MKYSVLVFLLGWAIALPANAQLPPRRDIRAGMVAITPTVAPVARTCGFPNQDLPCIDARTELIVNRLLSARTDQTPTSSVVAAPTPVASRAPSCSGACGVRPRGERAACRCRCRGGNMTADSNGHQRCMTAQVAIASITPRVVSLEEEMVRVRSAISDLRGQRPVVGRCESQYQAHQFSMTQFSDRETGLMRDLALEIAICELCRQGHLTAPSVVDCATVASRADAQRRRSYRAGRYVAFDEGVSRASFMDAHPECRAEIGALPSPTLATQPLPNGETLTATASGAGNVAPSNP